jgi:ribonucleoside-diphosphate reductase alpha chain
MHRKTYTIDEAKIACLEYFNGDNLAADAAVEKYLMRNKDGQLVELTPNDYLCYRIPGEFHRIEQKYSNPLSLEEIRSSLGGITKEAIEKNPELKKKLGYGMVVPQGSPTFGIGNNYRSISLGNCYVLGQPTDSYGGILRKDEEIVQVCKRRGGAGIDISSLRPKGSQVNNAAMSSDGIVAFMRRYSNSTKEVAQNGRRGALLIGIDCRHPEILNFINAKRNKKDITGANISVKWHDDFFVALEKGKKYTLRFPVDVAPEKAQFVKEVDAKELWDAFIDSAWTSAEPGCFYWDTVINQSMSDSYADEGFKTIISNPCVTIDSWIMTASGPFQVRDLIGTPFDALLGNEVYKSKGFFFTGTKPVFKVITDRGYSVKITDNHRMQVCKNGKLVDINAAFLKPGDCLVIDKHKYFSWEGSETLNEGWALGSLVGDGTFSYIDKAKKFTAYLEFWGEEKEIMGDIALSILKEIGVRCDSTGTTFGDKKRYQSVKLAELAGDFGIDGSKVLGPLVEKSSSVFYQGFLQGWFDADGSVQGDHKKGTSVRLSCSILENLYVAQRMLSRLGIASTIYKNRREAQWREMPDGHGGMKEYWCVAQHELVISRDNIIMYSERVNFRSPSKKQKLQDIIESLKKKPYKDKFLAKVKQVVYCGIEPVFDCQVEDVHHFDLNGLVSHNCGEILMSEYNACLLMLMNLMKFVKNPYLPIAEVDWVELKRQIKIATRLMDNLVDLEIEKMDQIIAKIKSDPEPDDIKRTELELWENVKKFYVKGRRVGLGVTGLADMLAELNIKYDSQEALDFCDKLFSTFQEEVYRESANLAKERGAFPCWNWEKEKDSHYIKKLPKDIQDLIKKYGRRNIANLTMSPAGTTSLVTQTSSGIEPVYVIKASRRRKISADEDKRGVKSSVVDFDGHKWIEYDVLHPGFSRFCKATGKTTVEESSYYKCDAMSLDPFFRVKMQGVLQRHIDHSISSCLSDDNHMVHTSNGLQYIEKMIDSQNKGFNPLIEGCSTIDNTNKKAEIIEGFVNGEAECLRIGFDGMEDIVGTREHKLYVVNKDYTFSWKTLENLIVGDWVVGRTKMQCFGNDQLAIKSVLGKFSQKCSDKGNIKQVKFPTRMTKDLALFLGYIISDGGVSENGVSLSQLRNNITEEFPALVRKLFGLETHEYKDKRSDNLLCLSVNSRILRDYLEWIGIPRDGNLKRIPEIIFKAAGRSQTAEFLRGLTLDGYVSENGICVKTTTNFRLAREIQTLLQQFGISCMIQKNKENNRTFPSGNTYHCLESYSTWCAAGEAEKFIDLIGFAEERKNQEAKSKFRRPSRKGASGTIPNFGLREKFNSEILPNIHSNKLYSIMRTTTMKDRVDMGLKRETLLMYSDFGMKIPDYLLDESYRFMQIREIESVGKRKTFDLHVNGGHSYIVNGIVSHNTLNLSKDVTKETVSKLYLEGWKQKCKGLTVYRDGSLDGIIKIAIGPVNKEDRPDHIRKSSAPKRPVDLPCHIHSSLIKGTKWVFIIGLLHSEPYEVFGGKMTEVDIPKKFIKGHEATDAFLRKNAKNEHGISSYDLVIGSNSGDMSVVHDIANKFSPDNGSPTRLISMLLRHGAEIKDICEQIRKVPQEDIMLNFERGIQRILRKYVEDKTELKEKCPECKSKLIYEGGCVKCSQCPWSRCD